MVKTSITIIGLVVALGMSMVISGCESDAQTGALLGTAIGAGVGQLAGGNTEGTLIGAAVGGGAGYIVGNERDKKTTQREIQSVKAAQNTTTVWVTNTNGSKIPVTLTNRGPGFVGPRGEYYENLPTPEDLRPVYGF